jgi:tetratricopeptide (TPR) repeat protein
VARDLPVRQQTIRNTIDWSYHLLNAGEQMLVARLGVFVGGCTLEAAEAVCNADGDLSIDVLDGIVALLNLSLLRQEEGLDGAPRFTMLETVREYALDRLAASGEQAALQQRQAAYFLTLAETVPPGLIHTKWLGRLEVNHDNFRAALDWALNQPDPEIALRLGVALGSFWWTHGYQREGRQWFEAILTISTNRSEARKQTERWTSLRADALNTAALMAWARGDYARATALYVESLALARELDDEALITRSLSGLGILALYQGDYTRATVLLTEGLTLARELDDTNLIILPLINLGTVAWHHGDYARAATLLIESLAAAQAAEDMTLTAWSLRSLGMVAWLQGDYDRATALHIDSLPLSRELDDWRGITECIEGLAWIACSQGQATHDAPRFTRAARLLGAAAALRASTGNPMPPTYRAANDRTVANVRAQLGEATFAAAAAEGRAMTLEQAIAYALNESTEDSLQ